jgi:COMPASS (Complex proteins associated with Set1p) component shg1
MADTVITGLPTPPPSFIRPRFKLSELPVAREKRVAIDNLNYTFKKKGGFDSLRKKIWAEFTSSDGKENLTSRIYEAAEAEIDLDPKLLSRERGTAATLIEGAVDRRGVYKDVETEIDQLLAAHVSTYMETLQAIRRADVGDEQAAEEERVGSKTDDDYAKEFEAKAAERENNRAKLAELDKQMEEIKRKLMEAEEKKRREAQKKKEEEDRKRREAEEERRRLERQIRREEERKYEEQREKEREERRRRRREEDAAREEEYRRRREERERDRERGPDRDRERDRTRDRDHRDSSHRRSRHTDDRRDPSTSTPKDKSGRDDALLDEKALDDIALELLLNESKALADKSRPKHEFDFEKAEALESSGRKAAMAERLRRADRSRERDSKRRDAHDDRRDRRRSGSRSKDRQRSSRHDDDRRSEIEYQKQKERREREKEAKAYMKGGSQADAASAAGSHVSQSKTREEGEYHQGSNSPSSSQRKDYRDDDRDKRQSYRERDDREGYKRSRIQRSASPYNIDRYVPGGGVHRSSRHKEGETERDRERSKYRDRDREVDDYRVRKRDSESYRSHEKVRDRYRDRDSEGGRERSRSPRRRDRDGRDRDRDTRGDERDREKRRAAVPIDRYVPGR